MAIFHQTRTYTFKNILNALGKDADYIFSATVWAEELTKILPLVREVNFMLKSRYGENFYSVNSRSFTGIYVLLDAIARVGFSRPPSRKALIDTEIPGDRLIVPWKGVRFDKTGQNFLADITS